MGRVMGSGKGKWTKLQQSTYHGIEVMWETCIFLMVWTVHLTKCTVHTMSEEVAGMEKERK